MCYIVGRFIIYELGGRQIAGERRDISDDPRRGAQNVLLDHFLNVPKMHLFHVLGVF